MPDRRAGDAPVEAVDERQVEHDVGEVGRDGDDERRPGVLEPAEHPGRREHQEQAPGCRGGDPQVGDGIAANVGVVGEAVDQRLGHGDQRRGCDSAPISTASHRPSMPTASARSRWSPAPTWRATCEVVP